MLQPQVDTLDRKIQHSQNGEVNSHGPRNPHLPAGDGNRAIQEPGSGRTQSGEHQDGRHVGDDTGVDRQFKNVEADIQAELRIHRAKRRTVHPQQELGPRVRGTQTREQSEQGGDSEHRDAPNGVDDLAVTIELVGELRVDRAEPKSQGDAQPHRNEHGDKSDEEHRHGPTPGRQENLEISHLVKPQHLGVERGEEEEPPEHGRQNGTGDDEGKSTTVEQFWSCLRHE